MKKLSVAVVSKADKSGGGASRVADDLCDVLLNDGHQVDHWLGMYDEEKPFLKMLHSDSMPIKTGIKVLNRLVKYAGFPDLLPFEYMIMKYKNQLDKYDIVHFHDLSSMISPLTVSMIAKVKPTVWTFHDCSPFTAGCLYPFECNQYKSICKDCPQADAWPINSSLLSAEKLYKMKKHIHSKNQIHCITPSRWMSEKANSSGLFKEIPQVCPNGVDLTKFKPFTKPEKKSFRKAFDLPLDRKIVLLTAADVQDDRKGMKYSLEALRKLKEARPFLLIVGKMNYKTELALKGFDYFCTGYIFKDEMKARIFAASDVFLFCSLADNLPLVVLETMACAVPTVGFATGGIPEMVEQKETGFLTPMKDQKALEKALTLALKNDTARKWGAKARKKVVEKYSMENFLQNHLQLYSKILGLNSESE